MTSRPSSVLSLSSLSAFSLPTRATIPFPCTYKIPRRFNRPADWSRPLVRLTLPKAAFPFALLGLSFSSNSDSPFSPVPPTPKARLLHRQPFASFFDSIQPTGRPSSLHPSQLSPSDDRALGHCFDFLESSPVGSSQSLYGSRPILYARTKHRSSILLLELCRWPLHPSIATSPSPLFEHLDPVPRPCSEASSDQSSQPLRYSNLLILHLLTRAMRSKSPI